MQSQDAGLTPRAEQRSPVRSAESLAESPAADPRGTPKSTGGVDCMVFNWLVAWLSVADGACLKATNLVGLKKAPQNDSPKEDDRK